MMGVIIYTLQRLEQSDTGTFGTLSDTAGTVLCHTCELPPNDNHPDTSCIPSGFYTAIPHNSATHPNTWEISNVPGRSNILIHSGNVIADSKGCLLVGLTEGWIGDQKAVLSSMAAMNKLRDILPDTFTISILDIDE